MVLHQDTDKQTVDNPNTDKVPLKSHRKIFKIPHRRSTTETCPPKRHREIHAQKSVETLRGLHQDVTETLPRNQFTSDASPIHHQDDIQQFTCRMTPCDTIRRARDFMRSCAEILYAVLAPPCNERSRGPPEIPTEILCNDLQRSTE